MTVAELHIAADHASFAGHFPGFPILPGAVLLDEALHEIVRDRGLDLSEWQVAAVKFLARVHPGDVLTLEYSASNESTIHFSIRTAAAVAVSGTLSVTRRDVPHGD
jgi:3-hydroxymyristoyl/3-hydroxydecanoyl-(acyl carrier protein) dehydratase